MSEGAGASPFESPGTSVLDRTTNVVLDPWNVILLNDDHHTFDEVIEQLQKALNRDKPWCHERAMEVHNTGSSIVYTGPKERAELVAEILEEIKLKVKIEEA